MSLWQNLMESYDKNADALKAGYPLSSTSISNNNEWIAVIVIDGSGNYVSAYKIEKAKESKDNKDVGRVSVTIPTSEESLKRAGKSSKCCPYPVFDQYDYLKGSGEKFDHYIQELGKFANSVFATPQVKAIYAHVVKQTVEAD